VLFGLGTERMLCLQFVRRRRWTRTRLKNVSLQELCHEEEDTEEEEEGTVDEEGEGEGEQSGDEDEGQASFDEDEQQGEGEEEEEEGEEKENRGEEEQVGEEDAGGEQRGRGVDERHVEQGGGFDGRTAECSASQEQELQELPGRGQANNAGFAHNAQQEQEQEQQQQQQQQQQEQPQHFSSTSSQADYPYEPDSLSRPSPLLHTGNVCLNHPLLPPGNATLPSHVPPDGIMSIPSSHPHPIPAAALKPHSVPSAPPPAPPLISPTTTTPVPAPSVGSRSTGGDAPEDATSPGPYAYSTPASHSHQGATPPDGTLLSPPPTLFTSECDGASVSASAAGLGSDAAADSAGQVAHTVLASSSNSEPAFPGPPATLTPTRSSQPQPLKTAPPAQHLEPDRKQQSYQQQHQRPYQPPLPQDFILRLDQEFPRQPIKAKEDDLHLSEWGW